MARRAGNRTMGARNGRPDRARLWDDGTSGDHAGFWQGAARSQVAQGAAAGAQPAAHTMLLR